MSRRWPCIVIFGQAKESWGREEWNLWIKVVTPSDDSWLKKSFEYKMEYSDLMIKLFHMTLWWKRFWVEFLAWANHFWVPLTLRLNNFKTSFKLQSSLFNRERDKATP